VPGTLWGIQLFCTFALTGLIWVIQLVHYPSFAMVEKKQFKNFHQFHSRQISRLVIPLMVGELFSAALLLAANSSLIWWINLVLALAPWIFTFALSVPAHQILAEGYDAASITRLVNTNWWRTITWSLKAILLLLILQQS
jgi:phosphatidylserine synthase